MSEIITLELPDDVAHQVRTLATAANRQPESLLLDWIRQALTEPDLESLPAGELLKLCDAKMATSDQEELSELLARNRDGTLDDEARARLDQLLLVYRRGFKLTEVEQRELAALQAVAGKHLEPLDQARLKWLEGITTIFFMPVSRAIRRVRTFHFRLTQAVRR